MGNLRYLFVGLSVFALGCSSLNPKAEYMSRVEGLKANAIGSFEEALKKAPPTHLSLSKKTEYSLSQEDRTLNIDNSFSYFELFQFEGKKGETYEIAVNSYHRGEPLGGMYIAVPELFIYEREGSAKKAVPFFAEGKIPAFGRYRFTKKWSITPVESGSVNILINADTHAVGEHATTTVSPSVVVTSYGSGTVRMHHDFYYDYVGQLDIEVTQID